MTAAFWFQLALAGLLVVLAMTGVASALQYTRLSVDGSSGFLTGPLVSMPRSLLSTGSLLALAAWLAVTAFGLRRGSRVAYWLSLAGLVLPLLAVVAASALGLGTTYESSFYAVPGDARDASALAERLAMWAALSNIVNGATVVAAPVLVVATVGMLMTATSRRYFAGSVPPGNFRPTPP